ncbi:unnamed protein product, partial [Mesorhabditis belari]|uniref:Uncharacterized protein n=1 Tax=Mesorhabditis belari TaxID=2138241 RepID=A0AAF3EU13_9BILA
MLVRINILAVLLVILATALRSSLADSTFICSYSLRCPQKSTNGFEALWLARIREIEGLKKYHKMQVATNDEHKNPPYWVTRLQMQHCREPLMGVFLDTPSKPKPDWETHCAWTGDGEMQECVLAPSGTGSYSFLSSTDFSARIHDFRKHIGCPSHLDTRVPHGQVSELHICTERCHQAGLSTWAAFFLMLCGFLGLLWNCITLETWILHRNQRRWLAMREANENQGLLAGNQLQGVIVAQPPPNRSP